MYEYLTGVVTFINPYYIVVETNGIGYQIALEILTATVAN